MFSTIDPIEMIDTIDMFDTIGTIGTIENERKYKIILHNQHPN